MDINNYSYINVPGFTGEIKQDVKNLLIANSKYNTLEHVKAVAETNIRIAEKYNLNKTTCEICGYMHDISIIIKPDDMLTFAQLNKFYIDESEKKYPFLLHQRISKLVAESFFHITDCNILSAIECHTTLKANLTPYDMALFVADKLSWDQNSTPPFYKTVNECLNISLEKASLAYMNYMTQNKLILYPHLWFIAGKSYLENQK